MTLFRYAQDYYGDWLPVQLLPEAGALCLWAAILFAGLHLLRRSRGEPLSRASSGTSLREDDTLYKYSLGQRLYHWGNFFFLLVLIISGMALFVPRSVRSLRYSWMTLHEIFALLFALGLLLHVVAALSRGEPRSMGFGRRDWRDLKLIVSNFLGGSSDYPRFGKYDPLQKLYHAALTLLSLALLSSGAYLWISAENLATFSHEWMRWQRLIHDLSAFLLMALVVGHIYFGIIRINWPSLAAIIFGRLKGSYFLRRHTEERWKPDIVDR